MPARTALSLVTGLLLAAPPDNPILPKSAEFHQGSAAPLSEVIRSLEAQTGLRVTSAENPPAGPLDFGPAPAWAALERVAEATRTRLVRRDLGRRVELVPRTGPAAPSSVSGPFRVELERVTGGIDFASGRRVTELGLVLHWEPRLAVVRAEGQPTIEAAEDDLGSAITAAVNRGRTPTTGAEFLCTVPLSGVPRAARRLERVAGTFRVTAAEQMLLFDFGELKGLPIRREQQGVRATISRAEAIDGRFEVTVELLYPESTPEFESFESFTAGNEVRLGGAAPADSETNASGRRTAATYRFPAAGGRFTLTTPGPLREVSVPWELRGVALP